MPLKTSSILKASGKNPSIVGDSDTGSFAALHREAIMHLEKSRVEANWNSRKRAQRGGAATKSWWNTVGA
jgi:hypothetical protein